MSQNYATWPTAVQVIEQLTVAGVPIRSGVDNSYYTKIVDGVVDILERKTLRQFIADTEDSTRYFDGSGTGEVFVDDLVELTSIKIAGWIGQPQFTLLNAVTNSEVQMAKNKVIIAQGPPYQFVIASFIRFPEGRQNIQVTAKWGYAQYIPDSVWLAVRGMAASIMAAHFYTDDESGRILASWVEGSSSEKYMEGLPHALLEQISGFKEVVKLYRRPSTERLRRKRRVMV